MKYWAFISYSHKDTAVADWLHPKLETYRVPGSLVGRPSRDGTVPQRLNPIFRDREELPTSAELGDNLQRSLQQSRYLVVICSPAAAQSRWVEEEIRAFKTWHGRDRIIALIAGGVPNARNTAEECFPHSLRYDSEATDAMPVRVEPIAADLRPDGDGRQRAFLKVVAGLLGVGFDDLYQREKRRQQRRRVLAGTGALAAVVLIVGTWWSIARLGRSQRSMRQEMATVREDAAVMTMEYKDVRPKNSEAENRIRLLADDAQQALDRVDEALRANRPDPEYRAAYEAAGKAVVAVVQQAKSSDESIFAAELQKPLVARLLTVGNQFSAEMTRRAHAQADEAIAKAKERQRKRK